ncbi:MAG: lysophospholipid acyltransferase family protein [Candidatus Limiplasma sp.]|nr:lysophospholipid acyltransferase family protein [Candidatus Limiplasma sp.]
MTQDPSHNSQRPLQAAKPARERFSFLYRVARGLSWLLFHTVFPIRYHGVEKAQLDAPFMIIANHNNMLDPLIVGWKCKRYQIRFLGKKELAANPFLKWVFAQLHMIPVDRHNMDMTAVRTCLKALNEGHALGIFPEGTRHKQGVMQDLESGVAILALRAKVPLLPVLISRPPRLFKRAHCYYGDPIRVDELAAAGIDKANCDRLLALITQTYEGMVAAHEKSLAAGL